MLQNISKQTKQLLLFHKITKCVTLPFSKRKLVKNPAYFVSGGIIISCYSLVVTSKKEYIETEKTFVQRSLVTSPRPRGLDALGQSAAIARFCLQIYKRGVFRILKI
jgi:hypothetical protein